MPTALRGHASQPCPPKAVGMPPSRRSGKSFTMKHAARTGSPSVNQPIALTEPASLQADGESYRLLFERHPVPMWVYDPKTLTFLAVNEAMLRHYGYTRDELLGHSVLDIRTPDE